MMNRFGRNEAVWCKGREAIFERLEERIVLDGAAEAPSEQPDIASEAVSHSAQGPLEAAAAQWVWKENAWCYEGSSYEWWWGYDDSWYYHGTYGDYWWHFDWNDGWEYFFDAFYEDRFYFESEMYWGHDGSDWYYSKDPQDNWNFSSWTRFTQGKVDFEPTHDTGWCWGGSEWKKYGRLRFMDNEYGSYGYHGMSEFDADLYDGVGWSHEPVTLYWDYQSGAGQYHCTVHGQWTGEQLMVYYIKNPSSQAAIGEDLDVIFRFNEESSFHYLDNYMEVDWRVVYYDSTDWSINAWVYYTHLISFAENKTPIDDLAIHEHGWYDNWNVGSDTVTNSNFNSQYRSYFEEIGEVLTPWQSDIQSWHCLVAGNADGKDLCRKIANATGAWVWASEDLTCIVESGNTGEGDYTLEFGTSGSTDYGPSWQYSYFDSPWDESRLNPSYQDT